MRYFAAIFIVMTWLAAGCGGQAARQRVEDPAPRDASTEPATHHGSEAEGEMCMEPPPDAEPEPCEE
jgi:hypothetical protein